MVCPCVQTNAVQEWDCFCIVLPGTLKAINEELLYTHHSMNKWLLSVKSAWWFHFLLWNKNDIVMHIALLWLYKKTLVSMVPNLYYITGNASTIQPLMKLASQQACRCWWRYGTDWKLALLNSIPLASFWYAAWIAATFVFVFRRLLTCMNCECQHWFSTVRPPIKQAS